MKRLALYTILLASLTLYSCSTLLKPVTIDPTLLESKLEKTIDINDTKKDLPYYIQF